MNSRLGNLEKKLEKMARNNIVSEQLTRNNANGKNYLISRKNDSFETNKKSRNDNILTKQKISSDNEYTGVKNRYYN